MSYTLTTPAPSSTDTRGLRSFWLYCDFTIDPVGTVSIQSGYFAIHGSWGAGYSQGALSPREREDFTITEERGASNGAAFTANQIRLIARRSVERSYSLNYLELFRFRSPERLPPTQWFSESYWKSTYRRRQGIGEEAFWPHTLDLTGGTEAPDELEDITSRFVHGLVVKERQVGPENLTLITPFIQPSVFAHLLTLHQRKISLLQLNSGSESWSCFDNLDTTDLPGEGLVGCVFVAQGAFKSIAIDGIEDWSLLAGVGGNVATGRQKDQIVLERLIAATHRATRHPQNLENFDRVETEDVVAAGGEPVEVLRLDGLSEVVSRDDQDEVADLPLQGFR